MGWRLVDAFEGISNSAEYSKVSLPCCCCLWRQCKSDKPQMGQKIPLLHILLYESVRISNAMRSTLTHAHTNTHTHIKSLHKCWWFVFAFYGAARHGVEHEHSLAVWPASQIQEVCQKWTHQNRIPKQNNNRRTTATACGPCMFSVMVNGNTTGKIIMLSISLRLRESIFMEDLGWECRWIRVECELDTHICKIM